MKSNAYSLMEGKRWIFKLPQDTHNADIKIIYENQKLLGNANVIFIEYKRHILLWSNFLKNAHKKDWKEVHRSANKSVKKRVEKKITHTHTQNFYM